MRGIPAEAASFFGQTGWLSHVPEEFREVFLGSCLCRGMKAGQAITHGGEETGGVFGIVSGSAGVFSAIGSSEGPLIHIAAAGFWFGLFPVVNGHPRIISVTTRTPCVVAQMPKDVLQSILERTPEMWRWLNLLSLEGAALAVQALADLHISDSERRCVAVLLRIAGCRESGDGPAIADLTQDDLAALSNLSRPTVSVIVRSLADRGFVSTGYRAIEIHAPRQLRRLVG